LLEFKPDGLDVAFNTYDNPSTEEDAAKPLTIHGTRSDFNLSADKLNIAIGGKNGGSRFGAINIDESVEIIAGIGDEIRDDAESLIQLKRYDIFLACNPHFDTNDNSWRGYPYIYMDGYDNNDTITAKAGAINVEASSIRIVSPDS
jgi:hypothetical protein